MTDQPSQPSIDPAAIEPGPTTSITIDISGLLRSQASDPVKLQSDSLEPIRDLAATAEIASLIGLVSRSVDFALGFLDLAHFRILVLLSATDSMSVAEIVDAMKVPARKLLTLLDSMESAGWIYTAKPRRGISESVAISEQGRALVDEVTTKRQQEINEILERVPERDRAAIAQAFSSFATAANEPAIRHSRNGIAP